MLLQAGVMIIVNTDGQVLSVSRKNDKTKFGFPGGKVESAESPMAAAIRETKEETSIIVHSCIEIYKRILLSSRPNGASHEAHCFYATSWSGLPCSSEEGIVKWIDSADLLSDSGAFPEYNKTSLIKFREMFPEVYLK